MHSSQENEAVEYIREELREMKFSERKQKREKMLEKNRPILGEFFHAESLSTENVVTVGKKLKKKPLSIKEYRNLQNGIIQSQDNIDAFLSVDNVISALARDLSGNNPAIKLAAANCCCNIALGNSKACFSLTKSTVPYLTAELDSLSYPLVEVCAWTIGNLAVGSDKAFTVLLAQGCVKHLVKLMSQCDVPLLPAIIYALIRCVYAGHNYIDDEDMVDLTRAIINRSFPVTDFATMWLLALLSSRTKCIKHFFPFTTTIVDCLCKTLQNDVNEVQVVALIRILANTVTEPTGQVAESLLNNSNFSVESLFGKLLMHFYAHVRKETLWLIGNIYNHTSPQIREKLKDIMPRLTMLGHAVLLLNFSENER